MPLHESQELFWRAMSWPTGVEDFLAQAEPALRQRFAATFSDFGGLPAQARMDIYANSYFWRLQGILEENHPVIAWLLGAEAFQNLCTDYVLHRPSQNADLAKFTRPLPEFLAGKNELDQGGRLAQIAGIENRVGELLHAPERKSLESAALAQVQAEHWPELRFRHSRLASLFEPELDYVSLDDARREQKPAPSPAYWPLARPGGLLLWRRGHVVRRRHLAPDEFRALADLFNGEPFGAICARLAADGDPGQAQESAGRVVNWLRNWLSQELIESIQA